MKKSMSLLEWALLMLLSVLWGGSFFFVGVAVTGLPPFTIVVLRVGLAALTLGLVGRFAGLRMPSGRRIWTAFACMGLLNNVLPFSLIVWGQTHLASGLAAILNATTPLFTVLVAHFGTKDEKLTWSRAVGMLIGFVGVVAIVGPLRLGRGDGLAPFAVLGAAACYAVAGVFGRRFARMGVQPLATATGQVTASTLLLLPLAALVDQPWSSPMPGWDVWGAVAGLALVSTALAYSIYFRILATAGATNLLLVTFLVPVSAILLGAAFLGETLGLNHYAGLGLLGVGFAVVDGRLLRLIWGRCRLHHGTI